MTSRSFAAGVAMLLLLAGAVPSHAATTIEREFRFAPERIRLTAHGDETEITATGGMREFRAGRPDLPWIGQRVELPLGMRVASIEVLELRTEPLAARVRVPSAAVPRPGL